MAFFFFSFSTSAKFPIDTHTHAHWVPNHPHLLAAGNCAGNNLARKFKPKIRYKVLNWKNVQFYLPIRFIRLFVYSRRILIFLIFPFTLNLATPPAQPTNLIQNRMRHFRMRFNACATRNAMSKEKQENHSNSFLAEHRLR